MEKSWDNVKTKCVITDKYNNTIDSDVVLLKLKQGIMISKQPSTVTVNPGERFSMSVTATGDSLKYDWKYQYPNQTGWTSWANEKTNTLSRPMEKSWDNVKTKCVITDKYNNTIDSDVVLLKLK